MAVKGAECMGMEKGWGVRKDGTERKGRGSWATSSERGMAAQRAQGLGDITKWKRGLEGPVLAGRTEWNRRGREGDD